MLKRAIGAALSAAALTALAACATPAVESARAGRASAPHDLLASLDFSRIDASLFEFRRAEPLLASADADPSYALPHEEPNLAAGRLALYPHTDQSRGQHIWRAAAEAPEGWGQGAENSFKHRASGLECPRSIDLPEEKRAFPLVDIRKYDAKNLDVSCNYSDGNVTITFYASFWPDMSLEDSAGGAVQAIMQRYPVKGQLPVSLATISSMDGGGGPLLENLEQPAAIAFDIGEMNGAAYKTSLWLVKTYGWHVKARATYAQQDVSAEVIAALMFAFEHLLVRAKNIEEPMTAGGEV